MSSNPVLNESSSSNKDESFSKFHESSNPEIEASDMTRSWIENNHNKATIKIRPKHKVNLSLDLNSLDEILKDLNHVMPLTSPPVSPNKLDLDFATLPRKKRSGKGVKDPRIALSTEKINQLCFGDVQNESLESPKHYSPTAVPWNSMTDIVEVENSEIGLGSKSNIIFLEICLNSCFYIFPLLLKKSTSRYFF